MKASMGCFGVGRMLVCRTCFVVILMIESRVRWCLSSIGPLSPEAHGISGGISIERYTRCMITFVILCGQGLSMPEWMIEVK